MGAKLTIKYDVHLGSSVMIGQHFNVTVLQKTYNFFVLFAIVCNFYFKYEYIISKLRHNTANVTV